MRNPLGMKITKGSGDVFSDLGVSNPVNFRIRSEMMTALREFIG